MIRNRTLTGVLGGFDGIGRLALAFVFLAAFLAAVAAPGTAAASNDSNPVSDSQRGGAETIQTTLVQHRLKAEVVDVDGQKFWAVKGYGFSSGQIELEVREAKTNATAWIFAGFPLTTGPIFTMVTDVPYCKGNETHGAYEVTAVEQATGLFSNTVYVTETC